MRSLFILLTLLIVQVAICQTPSVGDEKLQKFLDTMKVNSGDKDIQIESYRLIKLKIVSAKKKHPLTTTVKVSMFMATANVGTCGLTQSPMLATLKNVDLLRI